MFLPVLIVTQKIHSALFPVGSENKYVTVVAPTRNSSVGLLLLLIKFTVPEISVAEGSCQETIAPGNPSSIVSTIGKGQFITSGGVVSTV